MKQETINIIFWIIIFICIITMLILYISIYKKISNTLTLDKLKVKDIEINDSLNINPDILIKGNFNLDKYNKLLKNNNKLQVFYIKNDENKNKIPMELHLNELLYLIYTIYKYQFMETPKKNNTLNDLENSLGNSSYTPSHSFNTSSDKSEDIKPKEQNNEPEDKKEDSEDNINIMSVEKPIDNSDDVSKETFKNIPGYNIYYY